MNDGQCLRVSELSPLVGDHNRIGGDMIEIIAA
jgi:hypothetical protein